MHRAKYGTIAATAVLILVFGSFPLFATQFLFDMDHPVYEEMDDLFILEGKTSASGIRPWSDTDVRRMLSEVNPKTAVGKILKERIEGYLEDSEKAARADLNVVLAPTASYHTNTSDFPLAEDWFGVWRQDREFGTLGINFSYKEVFSLYADASLYVYDSDLKNFGGGTYTYEDPDAGVYGHYTFDNVGHTAADGMRFKQNFAVNIPVILNSGDAAITFPTRTYLSLGSPLFRFTVGRTRLSWGNGMMGNLMLGDTIPYHDYASFTYNGASWFNWQVLLSFFSHSREFAERAYADPAVKGRRFFLGNRFEFYLPEHSLKLALNGSLMYASETNHFSFPGHSNPLVTAEVEWAPTQGLSVYAQGAFDETSPAGWGIMLGLRGEIPAIGEDFFYYRAEAVYTSPYLYHRALSQNLSDYDLYYISSVRLTQEGSRVRYISRYLSLPFGSDAIAAQLRFGYRKPGVINAEANIFAMAHGIINEYSAAHSGQSASGILSTENPFAGDGGAWEKKSGVIEYTLVAGGEAEWQVLPWLTIDGGVYGSLVWNKDNTEEAAVFDLQISAGITLHY